MKKVIYKENDIIKEVDFNSLDEIENIEFIEDEKEVDESSVKDKIISVTPILCLIVYLIIGFYKNLWHPGWLIFLLIPLVPMFLNVFSRKKINIVGALTLLICVTYLFCGFVYNLWHPGWIMFLLIPVVSILFGGEND